MADPLKVYREERGLSQGDVAAKLGISRQMVNFLESGKREYSVRIALLMEKKLGIDRSRVLPALFARAA